MSEESTSGKETERGVVPIEPTQAPACVLQIYGGTLGRRYEFDGREFVVGRDTDNDICVDMTTVSRRHARLFAKNGEAWVEDLGSTNGTLVNDEPIDGPRQLHNGDQLRFGSSILKFIAGGNVEALYHEEIYRLMITDGLTGAATQRAFLEFLDREMLRAKRHARPLSLVMLDIDRFKEVNDQHSHLAGDSVLRVRAKVESQAFAWKEHMLHVTISVGGTSTEPDEDQAALLARADARLYEAKRAGRNCCVLS
jgi:two-component system cell cycle response regulator